MFKKIMSHKVYCGLDIGSQTVKASAVRAQDADNLELLGVCEVPTAGIQDGSVSDLGELSDCIRRACDGLRQKTGVRVKDLQVGLGGEFLQTRMITTVIPLVDHGTKIIGALDVKKVRQQACLLGVQLDEEVVHDFPCLFRVDDVNTALNPLGLFGRKLEISMILVVGHVNRLRNIAKAVHQAGYEVACLSFSSYAAAEVALDKKVRQEGTALIDIGSDASSIIIIRDNMVRQVEIHPWGGRQISRRIANDLHLSSELAEEIKKSHGVAQKIASDEEEEILVKKEQGYVPVRRQGVCDAIDPEIGTFLDFIRTSVSASPLYHQLNAGIVMVGGGALLPGLVERVEEVTHLPVTTGVLTKGLNNSAVYAASVGLAQNGCTRALTFTLASHTPQQWNTKIVNFFKELYEEYF